MALIVGGGGTTPIQAEPAKQRKKRKDKEAAQQRNEQRLGPQVVAGSIASLDAEARAKNVMGAYYRATGRMPSAENLFAFTEATKDMPLRTQEDWDSLFPSWIKDIPNPNDWKPWEFAVTRVQQQLQKQYFAKQKIEQAKPAEGYQKHVELAAEQKEVLDIAKTEQFDKMTKGDRISEQLHSDKDRQGTLMDPQRIINTRDRLYNKDRYKLSQKDRADLNAWALKFSDLYDQSDGFAEHYGNDLTNVQWDGYFDKFYKRYIVEANLAYALGYAKEDTEAKQKRAMTNITKAFGGDIQQTDDLMDTFKMLKSTGAKDDGLTVEAEYRNWMFSGFSNGRRDLWTDQKTIAEFVEEFGIELLPDDMKKAYDENFSDWQRQMAKAESKQQMAMAKLSEYKMEFGDALIESMMEDLTGVEIQDVDWTAGEEEPAEKPRQGELDTVMGITGKAGDPEINRYIRTEIAPAVNTLLKPVTGGIGEALSWMSIQKNRIWLTAMYMDRYNRRKTGMETILGYTPEDTIQAETVGEKVLDVLSMNHAISTEAWRLSDEQARAENRAYWREVFRGRGMDPDEHGGLIFTLDLGWEMATDLPLELVGVGGIKAGASFTAKVAAKSGRKFLSPKLALKVTEAENVLAKAEEAALKARAKINRLEAEENIARSQGDRARASALRQERLTAGKERGTSSKAVEDAKETVSLLQRPHWYDVTADALSRAEQREGFLAYDLFRLDYGGMDVEHINAMNSVVKRIAKSRDADEITELMNHIRYRYAQDIDPGTDWLFHKRFKPMYATENMPRRINGTDNIGYYIGKLYDTTHFGLKEGSEEARKILDDAYDRVLNAKGEAPKRIYKGKDGKPSLKRPQSGSNLELLHYEYRNVYDDLWKITIENLKKQKTSTRDLEMLRKYAKLHGVRLDEAKIADRYGAFKAFSILKSKRGAMHLKNDPKFFDIYESKTPFMEGQLAKDLVDKESLNDLQIFLGGHSNLSLMQYTGLLRGRGPTYAGIAQGFKTIALVRQFFGLSTVLIDEAWRPFFEGSTYLALSKPEARRVAKALAKDERYGKQIDRATMDAWQKENAASDHMVAVYPDDPDFPVKLNGALAMYSKEGRVKDFLDLERAAGETDEQFRARIVDMFVQAAKDPTDAGRAFRLHMEGMGRTFSDTYRSPELLTNDINAHFRMAKQAGDEKLEAAQRVKELTDRKKEVQKQVGSIPAQPSRKFVDAWIDARRGTLPTDDFPMLEGESLYDYVARALAQKRPKAGSLGYQIRDDWRRAVTRRRTGSDAAYRELKQIDESLASERQVRDEAARRLDAIERRGAPEFELSDQAMEWVNVWADRLTMFSKDDTIMAGLRGKKLKPAEVKDAIENLRKQGFEFPPIVGSKPTSYNTYGWVPGLSRYAEWKYGPYAMLDAIANPIRRFMFINEFTLHLDDLQARGMDVAEAVRMAGVRAERTTNKKMYTPGATRHEELLKNTFLFMPAYRQAFLYWMRMYANHPLTLGHARQKFTEDEGAYPRITIGDYQMALPSPLILTSGLPEMGAPGFSAPILLPFRVANSATGWSKNDEGNYVYTGATKLDEFAKFPPLSFMSKTTSPLMEIDDLLFAFGLHNEIPDETGNRWSSIAWSGIMGLLRDPQSRIKAHQAIVDAQIARGQRPDVSGAILEMNESPAWQRLLLGAGVENPEGILSALTRLAFVGRVTYKPDDVKAGKEKDILDQLFGNHARTMADAKYEYVQAYGDQAAMDAVLEKYPAYKPIARFYEMNAEEKEEWLLDKDNAKYIPYVSSKYNYENGTTLTSAEYFYNLKQGGIRRKTQDEYLADVKRSFDTVGWSKTLKKLTTDREERLTAARQYAHSVIGKIAANKQHKEQLLEQYDKWYYNLWIKGAAPDEYGKRSKSLDWLRLAAEEDGLAGDPYKWDIQAIQDDYEASLAQVETGSLTTEKGKRPEGVEKRGIIDQYSDGRVLDEAERGRMLRITSAMKSVVSPRYEALVDPRYSASWGDIKAEVQKKKEMDSYAMRTIASQEWWTMNDAAMELRSIGVKVPSDRDLTKIKMDLQRLYYTYKHDWMKNGQINPQSKEGAPIRAKYIAMRNAILARPGGEPFVDGPAGRLSYTYLTDPGNGVKIDKNYLRHSVAVMKLENPDMGRLVQDANRIALANAKAMSYRGSERALTAAAWASILAVSVAYRKDLAAYKNEYTGSTGITVGSKYGKKKLQKLQQYVSIWKNSSAQFASEWDELGGDKVLYSFLDQDY